MKQLIYFSAEWCGPCKIIGPVMEELKSEGYNIQKVDVDVDKQLSQKYGVRNIPTVILTVNGEETARKVGSASKVMYLNMYDQN
jgi:thioredoxin 1